MRFKNDCYNSSHFIRETEKLINNSSVAEFINHLEKYGEFEDCDRMYLDKHFVSYKVYRLNEIVNEIDELYKEFIITEDGRLFYYLSDNYKHELVDYKY